MIFKSSLHDVGTCRDDRRADKQLVLQSDAFCVLFLFMLNDFFCFFVRLDMIGQRSRAVTSSIAFISSSINPILYFFAGKSYIRREGLAFMARLFEGTGFDSTRKSRQNSQNSRDKDKDADVRLKDKDLDSVSNSVSNAVTNSVCYVSPEKLMKQRLELLVPLER